VISHGNEIIEKHLSFWQFEKVFKLFRHSTKNLCKEISGHIGNDFLQNTILKYFPWESIQKNSALGGISKSIKTYCSNLTFMCSG
jgi:hypothetical protein